MAKTLPTLNPAEVPAAGDVERGIGCLSTARGNLPLKRVEVEARIDGLVAATIVRQTFVNAVAPSTDTAAEPAEALEATYVFPLPDRAAVTRFEMRVGERLIEGQLRERGEARREYVAAIEAGHRAAIAEEDRSGVFSMRVGNILPGEEAHVTLELSGPLAYDDGEATFQFPLVVAPRYVPGIPLPGPSVGDGTVCDTDAVPDASRITPPVLLPGFPNPVELRLSVEVHDACLPLCDFQSSLHAVVEEQPAAGVRRITLHAGERLNRDFLLRFKVADASIRTSLVTTPDADGEGGTQQLTIVPPAGLAAAARPRDVVLVLDRSGSMAGWKMVTARRALGRMIDTLGSADRFAVLAFDHDVESPPGMPAGKLMPATDRLRFAAIEFLGRLEARGGTEIVQPLEKALDVLRPEVMATAADSRERIVALVTDGQVAHEDQVLGQLGARLAGVRMLTLGVDRAVNSGFLQKLAILGGGYTEVVESEDRLDAVLDRVHRRIACPVLTNLKIEYSDGQIESESQTPRRLADLFAGAALVVRSRYRGEAPASAQVSATDATGRAWKEVATARRDDARAIRSLWARDQIRAMEDEYAIGKGNLAALSKRIVECSLRFGVLSRFTAFVAVDRSEVANAGGECRQIMQPVDLVDGWDMLAEPEGFMCASFGGPAGGAVASFAPAQMAGDPRSASPRSRGTGGMDMIRRSLRSLAPKLRRKAVLDESAGTTADPRDGSPSIDLSAYRARADRLLADLRQKIATADATMVLGLLVPALTALVEDLTSIGAADRELASLRKVLDLIKELLSEDIADPSTAASLWQTAEAVLEKFARPLPQPGGDVLAANAPPPREEFWK